MFLNMSQNLKSPRTALLSEKDGRYEFWMIAHKLNDLIRDKVQSLKLCRSDYFYSSLILSAQFVLIATRNIWPFLLFENKQAQIARGFYYKQERKF